MAAVDGYVGKLNQNSIGRIPANSGTVHKCPKVVGVCLCVVVCVCVCAIPAGTTRTSLIDVGILHEQTGKIQVPARMHNRLSLSSSSESKC